MILAWLAALPTCPLRGTSLTDLVAEGARVERVARGFVFTEGPAWSPQGFLLFSDLDGDRIVKLNPDGTTASFLEPSSNANGLLFDTLGNLYVCQHAARRVLRISPTGEQVVLADSFDSKRLNSPNDLTFDGVGGLYFTDPRYGDASDMEQEVMGVYYLDAAGTVHRVVSDYAYPNGIVATADGTRLYVGQIDPTTAANHGINVYPILAPGVLGPGRRFYANFNTDGAGPDGMALDEHGNLYGTYLRAGDVGRHQIVVVNPEGHVIGRIPLPEVPANCAFGGADGRTLYITATSGLYRLAMKVRGGSASRLPSIRATRGGTADEIILSWPSFPGISFVLEEAGSPASSEWTAAPTGGATPVTVRAAARQKYFRLQQIPPRETQPEP